MSLLSLLFGNSTPNPIDDAPCPSEEESQSADRAHVHGHAAPDYHAWIAAEPYTDNMAAMHAAFDRGAISAEDYHAWVADIIHATCDDPLAPPPADQGTLLADDNGYWDADGYYHASQY